MTKEFGMSYNTIRLTSPADVLAHWPIFREGHRALRQMSNSMMSLEEYCKFLTNLSAHGDDVFIGVVNDGSDICYGVAQNATPPLSERKTFEVTSFYHNPAKVEATLFLMHTFEQWCREQSVHSYLVTTRQTRRTSGATIDCFMSEKYKFRKAYLAFEKKL